MLLQFAFVLRFAFWVQILIFVPMYLVGHSTQQYRPVCPGEFQGPDGHHVLGFRPRCWGYTFLRIAGKPWSKVQSEHTRTAFCSQRYSILHCSLYYSLRIFTHLSVSPLGDEQRRVCRCSNIFVVSCHRQLKLKDSDSSIYSQFTEIQFVFTRCCDRF